MRVEVDLRSPHRGLRPGRLARRGLPWLVAVALGVAPVAAGRFELEQQRVVPLGVHLLHGESPDVTTVLSPADVGRILAGVNRIWSPAGIHFYVKTLVRERAAGTRVDPAHLLDLRAPGPRRGGMFHVYFVHRMPINGVHFPGGIFVKDTAVLHPVDGGADEPRARVLAHELGHALGLAHRLATTHLMASGTTGWALQPREIERARWHAERIPWVRSASDLVRRADTLWERGRRDAARRVYGAVAGIGGGHEAIVRARRRARSTRVRS